MATKKGISWRMMLSAFIALVILIGWTVYHANFVLARSMLFAFPGWETTYRGAWPRPFGGVVASDVTLIPPEGPQAGTFHFDHVSLDVPFFEYYRSAFKRKRGALVKSIHDLDFAFTGGNGDLFVPLTYETALFGTLTAAPFEAAGCARDDLWVQSDLQAMGLTPGNVELTLGFHADSGIFVKNQSLTAPGIGSIAFRREIQMQGKYAILALQEAGPTALSADEWHIKDDGFVAARNRYCASKDGVDVNEFVARHVRSVERLLALVGVAPQESLKNAYRNFTRDGGSLDVVVRYQPAISGAVYNAEALSAWLPYMHGELTVNGTTQPLSLVATKVRPWPEWADELTTFGLVQREDAAQHRDETSLPLAEATTATTPAAKAPVAIPAPKASVPTSKSVVSPATQTLASAEPPKPLASSTVASAAAVDDGSISHYRQLSKHVGEFLTIYRVDLPSIRVKISGVGKHGVVMVQRRYVNGYLEFALDRSTFDHAEK